MPFEAVILIVLTSIIIGLLDAMLASLGASRPAIMRSVIFDDQHEKTWAAGARCKPPKISKLH